nr:bifunctional DNA primase/polymerase [Zoogloea sp.]
MSAQKKTPADKAGAKESTTRDVSMTAHEEDHAATRAGAKPSIDAESLIRAGLPLIPLHRWDARDAKGRARGKSPIDGAWQSRDYDSREVLAQAERRGLNVGVRLPPTWMVLDVDPRNFPEGRDSLAELVADARLDLTVCPHG